MANKSQTSHHLKLYHLHADAVFLYDVRIGGWDIEFESERSVAHSILRCSADP